jgi:hypothetical protein
MPVMAWSSDGCFQPMYEGNLCTAYSNDVVSLQKPNTHAYKMGCTTNLTYSLHLCVLKYALLT